MKKFPPRLIGSFLLAALLLIFSATPVLAECHLLGCAPWGSPSCTCDDDPFWPCTKVTCSGGTCCVYRCTPGSCGCFTEETEIGILDTDKEKDKGEGEQIRQIKDLEPGEIVSSFDPETGEISEGEVTDVTKVTREGYYVLETESGKKVKVTAEHPFLAVKNNDSRFMNHELRANLKNIFSDTLIYRLIISFQKNLIKVLD